MSADLTGKPVTLVCSIVDAAAWWAENPFRWPDFHGLHLYRVAAFDALERLDELDATEENHARELLTRWADWARAHGHDVGMLDDTRAFLSAANAQSEPRGE